MPAQEILKEQKQRIILDEEIAKSKEIEKRIEKLEAIVQPSRKVINYTASYFFFIII